MKLVTYRASIDDEARLGVIHNDLIIDAESLGAAFDQDIPCLLYTSPSPRDATLSRMPSSA